jgi:hypothetical protein
MSDSFNPLSVQPHTGHPRFPVRTTIILILALIVFMFAMASQTNNIYSAQISATPTVTQPDSTSIVIQPEPVEASTETTTGVILGGIFLLLIIILGTLGVIRHKD